MAERSAYVRETMRREWGGRTRRYAAIAANRNSPFAGMLVERTEIAAGERVLDVATGPGVLAIAAAVAVGRSGSVLATDLAPEWGEVIAEEVARSGVANVEFRAMGAEELDLPDGSFDVALCQFGLMFVPEPVRALREMHRVLRVGGRLGIAVWSTADRVGHHLIWHLILAAAPPPPEERRLPSPLELGEPGLIERYVDEAGFREIEVVRRTVELSIDDPEREWSSRVDGAFGHVASALASFSPEQRTAVHDAAIATMERYRRGDEIVMPSEAILVTARR